VLIGKIFVKKINSITINGFKFTCAGGGTGFIGRNLKEFLLRKNYNVTTISRVKTGEKQIISWVIL